MRNSGDKDAFVRGTAGVEAFFDVTDLPGKNCFGVIPTLPSTGFCRRRGHFSW